MSGIQLPQTPSAYQSLQTFTTQLSSHHFGTLECAWRKDKLFSNHEKCPQARFRLVN